MIYVIYIDLTYLISLKRHLVVSIINDVSEIYS